MNILIGTNTHGRYTRQDIALASYKHLAEQYDCEVVDVQFTDHTEQLYDVRTLPVLNRSSKDVTDGDKRLPFVNDILNVLATREYDYFIYVNSDVILTNSIIKRIINEQPDCFACSRVDIQPVSTFQQIVDKQVEPIRYEIAGFDAFVFKTDWFRDNSHMFNDYLVGQPCWDQVYATIMRVFGSSRFANQFPPCCFHVKHDPTWQLDSKSPEQKFNHASVELNPVDRMAFKMFDNYLRGVLIHRKQPGLFMTPVDNEQQIEQQYFDKY
jgi:hypothetical protein